MRKMINKFAGRSPKIEIHVAPLDTSEIFEECALCERNFADISYLIRDREVPLCNGCHWAIERVMRTQLKDPDYLPFSREFNFLRAFSVLEFKLLIRNIKNEKNKKIFRL